MNMKKTKDILLLLPLRSILFVMSALLLAFMNGKSFTENTKWWSTLYLICSMLSMAVLSAVIGKRKSSYASWINFKKEKLQGRMLVKGILVMVLFLAVGYGGMMLSGTICYGGFYLPKNMMGQIPIWLAVINILALPSIAALSEDGIYTGAIHQLDKAGMNKWLAVIIPMFFYALQHCFIPFVPDVQFMAYRFLNFLPATVFIGIWYYKKREPFMIITGHYILDFATAIEILVFSLHPELI